MHAAQQQPQPYAKSSEPQIFHDAPESPASAPIISFRARHAERPGRLVLSATHVAFTPATPRLSRLRGAMHAGSFVRPYTELVEVRKTRGLRSSETPSAKMSSAPEVDKGAEILVLCWDGGESVLELRERDEAFNAVVGCSGRRWIVEAPVG